jgi:hypothetical protein
VALWLVFGAKLVAVAHDAASANVGLGLHGVIPVGKEMSAWHKRGKQWWF